MYHNVPKVPKYVPKCIKGTKMNQYVPKSTQKGPKGTKMYRNVAKKPK